MFLRFTSSLSYSRLILFTLLFSNCLLNAGEVDSVPQVESNLEESVVDIGATVLDVVKGSGSLPVKHYSGPIIFEDDFILLHNSIKNNLGHFEESFLDEIQEIIELIFGNFISATVMKTHVKVVYEHVSKYIDDCNLSKDDIREHISTVFDLRDYCIFCLCIDDYIFDDIANTPISQRFKDYLTWLNNNKTTIALVGGAAVLTYAGLDIWRAPKRSERPTVRGTWENEHVAKAKRKAEARASRTEEWVKNQSQVDDSGSSNGGDSKSQKSPAQEPQVEAGGEISPNSESIEAPGGATSTGGESFVSAQSRVLSVDDFHDSFERQPVEKEHSRSDSDDGLGASGGEKDVASTPVKRVANLEGVVDSPLTIAVNGVENGRVDYKALLEETTKKCTEFCNELRSASTTTEVCAIRKKIKAYWEPKENKLSGQRVLRDMNVAFASCVNLLKEKELELDIYNDDDTSVLYTSFIVEGDEGEFASLAESFLADHSAEKAIDVMVSDVYESISIFPHLESEQAGSEQDKKTEIFAACDEEKDTLQGFQSRLKESLPNALSAEELYAIMDYVGSDKSSEAAKALNEIVSDDLYSEITDDTTGLHNNLVNFNASLGRLEKQVKQLAQFVPDHLKTSFCISFDDRAYEGNSYLDSRLNDSVAAYLDTIPEGMQTSVNLSFGSVSDSLSEEDDSLIPVRGSAEGEKQPLSESGEDGNHQSRTLNCDDIINAIEKSLRDALGADHSSEQLGKVLRSNYETTRDTFSALLKHALIDVPESSKRTPEETQTIEDFERILKANDEVFLPYINKDSDDGSGASPLSENGEENSPHNRDANDSKFDTGDDASPSQSKDSVRKVPASPGSLPDSF